MPSAARATLLGLAILAPAVAEAQDTHYWTLQYGPVAELLGGTVVGSTRDLSGTYYNPGALALAKDPSFVASVESFEATRFKATTDAPRLESKQLEVRPSPSLFALAAPTRWTGRHTLALSVLTRQDLDLRLNARSASLPGQTYSGETLFDQDLTENWFGLTWAFPAGNGVGLGLTQYVAYRGQRTRTQVSAESAPPEGDPGAVLIVNDFDYSNYRLLWKAGIALERGPWALGLAATTPGVRLLGKGQGSYTRSAVGADLGGGEPVNVVSSRHEEDLESRYETPWSVALGAAYRQPRSTYHATLEWFGSVAPFDVLDTAPFQGDAAASGLRTRLQQEARSVVNFGAGFERRVSERVSAYAAFTTDFTFADQERTGAGNTLATWNIYHLHGGTSLQTESVKFTLGLAYSFGSDPRNLIVAEVPPGQAPRVQTVALDVSYSRINVLIGFDFGR